MDYRCYSDRLVATGTDHFPRYGRFYSCSSRNRRRGRPGQGYSRAKAPVKIWH